ncbi:uncharacterized protein LOC111553783 isoform X2 [Piliocolobus tephrosceles]|uniref:uncharacterized protein LOC111553783 isoform X2 n=1 Tax=Piliocolobus tephrosceles TaxID=591936 RepID=UPI000C29F0F6|nr:uncharacterized protein LOC111553783 isoform X2 [Piliocolobus tephrosceles]
MEGKQVSPGGNPGLRFAQRSPCECVEHLLCAGGTEGLSTSLTQADPGSHVPPSRRHTLAPMFTVRRETFGGRRAASREMGPHLSRGPDGVVLGGT